jgi:hypothetical protein
MRSSIKFDDARRCIDEAIAAAKTTKERWCEADIQRTAGDIELMSPEPDVANPDFLYSTPRLAISWLKPESIQRAMRRKPV